MDALNYGDDMFDDDSEDSDHGGEGESKCCEICSQYTMDDTNSIQLKCGHRFHTECMIDAYKKQQNTKVKQCQYCRTGFKYLPYSGGVPVKGLHDPLQVATFLEQYKMVNPDWSALVPDRSELYVIGGKYRYQKGVYRSATSKMVNIVLGDEGVVRTTKTNVLLIDADTLATAEDGVAALSSNVPSAS